MQEGKGEKIRAVVFDYGNVLCESQQPSDVQAMAEVCGLSIDEFESLYWPPRLAYDRADLDGKAFWSPLLRKGQREITPSALEKLIELDAESWGRPNTAVLDWVKQLKEAGLKLAVLSNMPAEIGRYLTANRKWLQLFPQLVFSYELRMVKPEAEIYQKTLSLLELPAHEVLFLDDRPENVAGAHKAGIHALVFENLAGTLSEIRRFDLPMPGSQRLATNV